MAPAARSAAGGARAETAPREREGCRSLRARVYSAALCARYVAKNGFAEMLRVPQAGALREAVRGCRCAR